MELIDRIDEALAAIRAELQHLEPILEGLRDYRRLDLKHATRKAVEDAIRVYERRVRLLQAAEAALEALRPGRPDTTAAARQYLTRVTEEPITLPPVSQAVYDDLAEQLATITAAFGEFHVAVPPNEAAAISIEWSAPEDQPKE